ncbi:bifunctional 4-hydroxy-2-oxoglutarate aldolase/2-dehydro-3-deoxy-phosphogluconate aldolase [Legionella israelensis]|uniref:Keto-hydroxyglutarate aldolase n=1 Tax=Legionella israelensis TaxID=454 RepID=A0A0W0VUT6_9GAMM|nr:bifunctional 4-hydroxy-2-oxoglutarate aldolase/2-dehydro-3-deoxy-phosphogluconate aldolase [Legionella israelensis]KTD23713.1 keto-hydroxyglutarate aldolase [Legionella israelensis]QBS10907.1 bifunctional 4-hydroxy-2-oxoglutarate aldolase/2-dehydro-3-deoxy-phosphogluconate aldolase [Legionella israelensis]SCX80107.1 KDPG and KHG aldolase [Legionella israelensis DSM 19235]STX57895.1 keto-hydroxyglutarate aldolase [Legionella israelensis]
MSIDKFLNCPSVIISLDIDDILLDRLKQIANAGFSAVEINCSEPGILSKVIKTFPDLQIGAGNIVNTQQLENCYQAGVNFATSPGFLPAIAQTASIYSFNYLPGVATLSEAMQVMALGYRQVRPFPADLSFCNLLNKCLPDIRQYPAEIEWEEAEHFFNLPSVAAVSIHNPELKQLNVLSSSVFA